MNRSTVTPLALAAVGLGLAGLATTAAAHAASDVYFTLGVPPPVYAPPPVVYVSPPVVEYAQPRVYGAPVYYYGWQQRRAWREEQWRRHREWERRREWRERHRDLDDDD